MDPKEKKIMDSKSVAQSNSKIRTQVIWAILANIPSISYGIIIGWMSPTVPYLQSDGNPTGVPTSDSVISYMGSALCLGGVVGGSLYGAIADRVGRKPALMGISALHAIAWALKLYSSSPTFLILARAVAGLASGGLFVVVPLYVAEITDKSCRGTLGTFLLFGYNVGIIVGYGLGGYVDYRTNAWVYFSIAILHLAMFAKAPETPSFLVKSGDYERARTVMAQLKSLDANDAMVQSELKQLKLEDENTGSERISILNIFRDRAANAAFRLSIVMLTLQSLGGCFAVITYASSIFEKAGGVVPADLQALAVAFVQLMGSVVATVCVERCGRKFLLTLTSIVNCISMVCLATWYLLVERGVPCPSWIPLTAVATFILSYAAGVGPLPYVIMAELFSFRMRSTLSSYVLGYSWCNSTLLLFFFKPITTAFGLSTMFFLFSGVILLSTVYITIFLPETSERSYVEIQRELRRTGKRNGDAGAIETNDYNDK